MLYLPKSQLAPLYPALHVQLAGAVHKPYTHGGLQIAKQYVYKLYTRKYIVELTWLQVFLRVKFRLNFFFQFSFFKGLLVFNYTLITNYIIIIVL